jgi:hypothetical protein
MACFGRALAVPGELVRHDGGRDCCCEPGTGKLACGGFFEGLGSTLVGRDVNKYSTPADARSHERGLLRIGLSNDGSEQRRERSVERSVAGKLTLFAFTWPSADPSRY